jgi:hypothetical protein
MDQNLKEKWVEALESGKYQQTAMSLFDKTEHAYCCLGVLQAVCRKEGIHLRKATDDEYLRVEQCERRTGLTYLQQKDLWSMNDSGFSFADIAKRIRETL